MNREILFRGLDVLGNLRYGSLLKVKDDYYISKSKARYGVINYKIHKINTIGQYTGLEDKNCKK